MRAYDPGTSTWSLNYFLTDHLGSTLAVLDDSGEVLSEQRYMPFGQVRTDVGTIAETDFGFTFQRALPETGLMDYQARFFAPRIGSFIQPDTIIPGLDDPQNWNRYSYVRNSPIVHSDPTGHMPWIGEGCNVNERVIEKDNQRLNEFRMTTERNKCKAGDKRYCGADTVEIIGFTGTMLVGGILVESFVLGGGAAATSQALFWRSALACLRSPVCRWFTRMAGGAGGVMSSYEKGVAGEKQVLRSLNDPSAVWQKQIDFEGNKYRLDIFIPKSKIIEVKNIAFGNVSLSQRLTS